MPIAHGEGQYVADAATAGGLEAEGRVVFRYVDEAGRRRDAGANPNGSQHTSPESATRRGTSSG